MNAELEDHCSSPCTILTAQTVSQTPVPPLKPRAKVSGRSVIFGFTLLEVLLALAIIAIGLGALFRASLITIKDTRLLKEKSLKHWVAMQGISMVQLGLLQLPDNTPANEKTVILNQTWYWRITSRPTAFPFVDSLEVSVSHDVNGPFKDPVYAFRYRPHEPS